VPLFSLASKALDSEPIARPLAPPRGEERPGRSRGAYRPFSEASVRKTSLIGCNMAHAAMDAQATMNAPLSQEEDRHMAPSPGDAKEMQNVHANPPARCQ
jgi:hypothetical protein